MPAGWRSVIVEHWPDVIDFTRGRSAGEVAVVQILPPDGARSDVRRSSTSSRRRSRATAASPALAWSSGSGSAIRC